MISMRYARNLAEGAGLVWNLGERVEGITNFGWTLVMAGVQLLPLPDSRTSLAVLVLTIGVAAAILWPLVRLTRTLGAPLPATILAAVLYLASHPMLEWTAAGMEAPLIALVVTWCAVRVLEERSLPPRPATYLALGVLPVLRVDAVVLAAALSLVALALTSDRGRVLRFGLASLILPVAVHLVRWVYYGSVVPNTADLKTGGWDGRVAAGVSYVADYISDHLLLMLLAVAGAVLIREARPLAAVAGVWIAYVAYAGGDAFYMYRFIVPVVPLLIALAAAGLGVALVRVRRIAVRAVAVAAVALLAVLTMPSLVDAFRLQRLPYDEYNIRLALELREATRPDEVVVDFWGGSVFYFSHRRGVDLLGKMDPVIAQGPVVSGDLPGHNKWNFDHSLARLQPDVVVANFSLPYSDGEARRALRGNYAFTDALWFYEPFRRACLPNPLPLDTWRTVFRCDW